MQYEVDSYILEYSEDEDKYYISFLDSAKNECKLEIDKDIFNVYMKSKKSYVKIKNETSRHLEHNFLTDEEIYLRASAPKESLEDEALRNIDAEKMRQALKELTDAQYRRIDLHIVNEISIRDVAKLEDVQTRQIQKSLKLGIKKIKKFFEK